MFEQYINKSKDELCSLFSDGKDKYFLSEILSNSELPKTFKAFISAEVDWWIYQEQNGRKSHANFDLADIKVSSLLLELDGLYKQKSYFSNDDLIQVIEMSVKLILNYLCRPRTTLKWFVFMGEGEKPINEILFRMKYFYDYNYIYDGFLKWVENHKNNLNESNMISEEIFFEIIGEIDLEHILDLESVQFVELLEPIFYFFNIIDKSNNELIIPIEALMFFFDDKGIEPVVKALENNFAQNNIKFINREELHDFLISVLAEAENSSDYKIEEHEDLDLDDEVIEKEAFEVLHDFDEDLELNLHEIAKHQEEDNIESLEEESFGMEYSNEDLIKDLSNNEEMLQFDSSEIDLDHDTSMQYDEKSIEDNENVQEGDFSNLTNLLGINESELDLIEEDLDLDLELIEKIKEDENHFESSISDFSDFINENTNESTENSTGKADLELHSDFEEEEENDFESEIDSDFLEELKHEVDEDFPITEEVKNSNPEYESSQDFNFSKELELISLNMNGDELSKSEIDEFTEDDFTNNLQEDLEKQFEISEDLIESKSDDIIEIDSNVSNNVIESSIVDLSKILDIEDHNLNDNLNTYETSNEHLDPELNSLLTEFNTNIDDENENDLDLERLEAFKNLKSNVENYNSNFSNVNKISLENSYLIEEKALSNEDETVEKTVNSENDISAFADLGLSDEELKALLG